MELNKVFKMNKLNYILQMGIIDIVFFVFIDPLRSTDEIILERIISVTVFILSAYAIYISCLRYTNACYSAFDVNTGEIKKIHVLYTILYTIALIFLFGTFSWSSSLAAGLFMTILLFFFPEPTKEQQEKIREKEKQSGSLL